MHRLLVAAALMGLCLASQVGAALIGDRRTRVYHRPTCVRVRKIPTDDLQVLSNAQAAAEQKYSPCDLCRPRVEPPLARAQGRIKTTAWKPPVKVPRRDADGEVVTVEHTPGGRVAGSAALPSDKKTRKALRKRAGGSDDDGPTEREARTLAAWARLTVRPDRPWVDTRIPVHKGQPMEIRAEGLIFDGEPFKPGQLMGIWNPDGLNRKGDPSHPKPKKRLYYLQGKVGEKTFRVGTCFLGRAPATGQLFLGVKDRPGAHDDNDGFFVAVVRVRKMKAPPKPAPPKAQPPRRSLGRRILDRLCFWRKKSSRTR